MSEFTIIYLFAKLKKINNMIKCLPIKTSVHMYLYVDIPVFLVYTSVPFDILPIDVMQLILEKKGISCFKNVFMQVSLDIKFQGPKYLLKRRLC